MEEVIGSIPVPGSFNLTDNKNLKNNTQNNKIRNVFVPVKCLIIFLTNKFKYVN